MTEREQLGRLLMVGWRGSGRIPSWAGGVLVLRPPLPPVKRHMLVAADVEDGLAQRFPDAVPHPSAMAVGATRDPRLAAAQGRAVGLACRAAGIHLAFAPVADVNSNPGNPIINTRAFGAEPGLVARMASAWAEGCQSAGVLACAKHFPGHGDTADDSHTSLPVVRASRATAWSRELVPFRACVRAGVASVMTAHVAFPAFDRVPATLSHALVTGILRGRLGFRGLVITDSLRMAAIAHRLDEGEAAVRALRAGCDLLLDPSDPEAVLARLLEESFPEGRIASSLARIEAAWKRVKRTPPPPFAAFERRVRREVARRSITALRGPVPRLERPVRLVVVDDGARAGAVAMLRKGFPPCRRPKATVVAVFAKARMNKGRIAVPRAKLAAATRRAVGPTVAILLGSPYVADSLPKGWAVVAAYSDAPDSVEAAVRAVCRG